MLDFLKKCTACFLALAIPKETGLQSKLSQSLLLDAQRALIGDKISEFTFVVHKYQSSIITPRDLPAKMLQEKNILETIYAQKAIKCFKHLVSKTPKSLLDKPIHHETKSLLFFCCHYFWPEGFKALIDAGASINQRGPNNLNILQATVSHLMSIEALKILTIITEKGFSSLELSKQEIDTLSKFIDSPNSKSHYQECEAAWDKKIREIKILLRISMNKQKFREKLVQLRERMTDTIFQIES